MRKTLSYVLPFIAACLALIPPIKFIVPPPPFEYWPLMITIVSFLGVFILFLKTNVVVKSIPFLILINCFFSNVPYISFNSYVSVVACCYFYFALTKMDSWVPTFNMLKSLMILNSLLMFMQFIGNDQMLNFGLEKITGYGVVGHRMHMGSFSVVLGACLSILHPAYFLFTIIVGIFTMSTWTLVSAGIGIWFRCKSKWVKIAAIVVLIGASVMCAKTGKIQAGLAKESGRLIVWEKSIKLLNERPLEGWGIGTYKFIFPSLGEMYSRPWKNAHNCWVQLGFELGYILFGLVVVCWIWLSMKLILKKQWIFFAGYLAISVDMLVHFPTRMIQGVPLIIVFLAYIDCQNSLPQSSSSQLS